MSRDIMNGQKPASILIVDDVAANLQVLTEMLEDRGYLTRPVTSGKMALLAAQNDPPDLVLLDITMPGMDGYEVCARMKADEKLKDIPVIFISALHETPDKVKGFGVGAADYVTKPFQFEEVRARVATHLKLHALQTAIEAHNHRLSDLVQAQVREISESQMATIFAMAKLAESRDSGVGRHLERVQTLCKLLTVRLAEGPRDAATITPAYVDNIFHGAPLHDIGKVAIPDSILLKDSRLTPQEFEVMKTHTSVGAATLEAVRQRYSGNAFLSMGIAIARSHHETWNGTGYPDGLRGEAIPLAARIMAIADVYDALRSNRCYKPALPHDESCREILAAGGAHFDPVAVASFRELQQEFDGTWRDMER
jgi:putative two-component system response regulator